MESLEVRDHRGGELVDTHPRPEPAIFDLDDSGEELIEFRTERKSKVADEPAWLHWTSVVISHLAVLSLGLFLAWVVFPHVVYVPVDPYTGQILREMPNNGDIQKPAPNQGTSPPTPGQQQQPNADAKGNDGRR